ncbi:hypothetical protein TMEN_5484 [Trichophyton mentagrophytes]|nr:hypothetical protein TMEN_5484 [Trichophyton mentagrophytes]
MAPHRARRRSEASSSNDEDLVDILFRMDVSDESVSDYEHETEPTDPDVGSPPPAGRKHRRQCRQRRQWKQRRQRKQRLSCHHPDPAPPTLPEYGTRASSSSESVASLFHIDVSGESASDYVAGHETDLTDPDAASPPPRREAKLGNRRHRRKQRQRRQRRQRRQEQQQQSELHPAPTALLKPSTKGLIDPDLLQSLYEDPPDDSDEDLQDVPSDYGGSGKTKSLKLRTKDRWQRFCSKKAAEPDANPKWRDPEEALRAASANEVHRFLNWVLGKLKRGKNGRKLKGIKSKGTLDTEWKYLSGYIRKVTGHPVDEMMSKDVHRGMRRLVDKHGLKKESREAQPVYIEDMVPFNETILQTNEMRFNLGLERLLLCFFNIICLYTLSRENAVLKLQLQDLLVTLQKHPRGGPPIPNIDVRPDDIKQKMGVKKVNTFALPEKALGKTLVFRPLTFLFGLLFDMDAFQDSRLKTLDDIRRLHPVGSNQQLEIPLKAEMGHYYVFPKVEAVGGKVRVVRDQPMSAGTLDYRMGKMSELMGWRNPYFSHQNRQSGGKLLDRSVTGAKRNVIMNHAVGDNRTFSTHYLPHYHHGMQEIMHGTEPDEELERAMEGPSRWADKRRPRYLTDAEKDLVEQAPELQAAIGAHMQLAAVYEATRDPALIPMLHERKREVTSIRQSLQHKARLDMRKGFSRKQALVDIDRQLSGQPVDGGDPQRELGPRFELPPEQEYLVAALMALPKSGSLEDEWRRLSDGTEAVRLYCSFPEGGPLRGRPQRSPPRDTSDHAPHEDISPAEEAPRESCVAAPSAEGIRVEETGKRPKPTRCFQCRRSYRQYGGLLRHFRTAHFKDRMCKPCNIPLSTQTDMQLHAWHDHDVQT